MNKAVIMDRDGTIFKDCHYLKDPDHIQIYQGVLPALKMLQQKGWKLIIGTNQSGIARGHLSFETLKQIHEKFQTICKKNHVKIDEIFFCPHHPQDRCHCRKPEIGMLLAAAKKFKLNLKECIIIGDKKSDMDWGAKAGARTILVLTGCGRKALFARVKADHISRTFSQAAQWILKNG